MAIIRLKDQSQFDAPRLNLAQHKIRARYACQKNNQFHAQFRHYVRISYIFVCTFLAFTLKGASVYSNVIIWIKNALSVNRLRDDTFKLLCIYLIRASVGYDAIIQITYNSIKLFINIYYKIYKLTNIDCTIGRLIS